MTTTQDQIPRLKKETAEGDKEAAMLLMRHAHRTGDDELFTFLKHVRIEQVRVSDQRLRETLKDLDFWKNFDPEGDRGFFFLCEGLNKHNKKIQAIKTVRQISGMSLHAAKYFVDNLPRILPIQSLSNFNDTFEELEEFMLVSVIPYSDSVMRDIEKWHREFRSYYEVRFGREALRGQAGWGEFLLGGEA